MKNLLLLILLFSLSFSTSVLANDKYEKAMLAVISDVYQSKDIAGFQAVINKLNRIAQAETNHWEPHYYIAYSYAMISMIEQDGLKKDEWIKLGADALSNAIEIVPQESELFALKGLLHTASIIVDPASRGAQYSGMAMQQLSKALAINPQNPRAKLLLGQMMFGTAQFMGGGTDEACDTIQESIELFDSFKSENSLNPNWGKQQALNALKDCEK